MRLAFVHPSFEHHGGAETVLVDAMRGLAERGHAVTLFTASFNVALYDPDRTAPFRLVLLGGRGFMEGLPGTLRLIRWLSVELRPFDLVIAGNFPANVWVALGTHHRPVVWWCMEPKRNLYPDVMYAEAPGFVAADYRHLSRSAGLGAGIKAALRDPHLLLPYRLRSALQRGLDQAAARRIRSILTISDYVGRKISVIYPRAQPIVVWVGVPEPEPVTVERQNFILVPTRLEPIKNVDALIRAVALLPAALNVQVTIIGDGSERERLSVLVDQLGLAERVQLLGLVARSERDRLYASCAFVFYPSRAEPLGLACIEAGLHRKAVIASSSGGPAGVVVNGHSGLLVDVTRPAEMAQAMRALIEQPERAAALGLAGYARVEPIMALPHWLDRFESLLSRFAAEAAH